MNQTDAPSPPALHPRAFAYLCASPLEPSVAEQRESAGRYFCEHLASRGYVWGGAFVDAADTARWRHRDRPLGLRLTAQLNPGDAVVIPVAHRAFRDARDLTRTLKLWQEDGIGVVLLDVPGSRAVEDGPALLRVLGVLAAARRGWRQEKVVALRAAGKLTGGRPPYGFKARGRRGKRRWDPDEEQRAVGRKIVEWKDSGFTWEEIYFHLLRLRVRNPRSGSEYSLTTLRRTYEAEVQLQLQETQGEASPPPAPSGTRVFA